MASKRTRIEADSPNESSWRVLLKGREARFPWKKKRAPLCQVSSPTRMERAAHSTVWMC